MMVKQLPLGLVPVVIVLTIHRKATRRVSVDLVTVVVAHAEALTRAHVHMVSLGRVTDMDAVKPDMNVNAGVVMDIDPIAPVHMDMVAAVVHVNTVREGHMGRLGLFISGRRSLIRGRDRGAIAVIARRARRDALLLGGLTCGPRLIITGTSDVTCLGVSLEEVVQAHAIELSERDEVVGIRA
jgi:hypothetical protein